MPYGDQPGWSDESGHLRGQCYHPEMMKKQMICPVAGSKRMVDNLNYPFGIHILDGSGVIRENR